MRAPRATIDFESRSSISLRKHGTWRYSIDPSTDILCLAFRLPTWDAGRVVLWHPAFPTLGLKEPSVFDDILELSTWIGEGGLVEAHNAWFEYCIWKNVLTERYAWPSIADSQWRCSAAKAAAHALPRALERVANILRVGVQKDMDGTKTMKKMTKPRKSRKAERELWLSTGEDEPDVLYHETPELLERLFVYCKIDVLAEEEVSEALPDLSPEETGIFLLDQKINARGFQLDQEAVASALALLETESVILNGQLTEVTKGRVQKATQRAQVKAWLHDAGVDLPDTQRATVEGVLTNPRLPYAARQGLEILRDLGRSSTAKYTTMEGWQDPDGIVRGGLLYHGASTGRWPLTGDHETLTPSGWVRLDTWQGGPIACWSPDGTIAFQEATKATFALDGRESLVHWQNSKVDQLSTGDHAMPAYRRERVLASGPSGGEFVRKTVTTLSSGDRIPLTGWLCRSTMRSVIQTRILVMVQADAHFLLTNGRSIRFRFTKARKIIRCKQLLQDAGIVFRERVDACDGVTVITISYADAPKWLWSFQHKTFSWDWVTTTRSDVFFEELQHWDGCKSSLQGIDYSTTNEQNANIVQALAHVSGMTCYVQRRERIEQNWNVSFRCFIDKEPSPVTFRGPQRTHVSVLDTHVYCAQTPSGYFLVRRKGHAWITGNSGAGVQPQNFVRGSVKDMGRLWEVLKTLDRELISSEYKSVMEALANALRGAIIPRAGMQLYVADYASIEARALLWLAEDDKALDIFRRHEDIYCDMASDIYKRKITKADEKERQIGKFSILGLGFGMGWSKFQATCAKAKIELSEDFARTVVDAYRLKYPKVKQMWYDQEDAAVQAWRDQTNIAVGRMVWEPAERFLYCRLPSSRRLAYPFPQVKPTTTPWGEPKWGLTFKGVNPVTRQWHSQKTYGGSIVENQTQACARDILAEALLRCEGSGYPVVLSVHDEIICETLLGQGSVSEFTQLMTQTPLWATGMPVEAESWCGSRYRK